MAEAAEASSTPSSAAIMLRSPDVHFAAGLIAIIFMMIVPLPPMLLDLMLCVSITIGFMVLLISIYVHEPLEFSTFPTVLLLATLFRLALNVATTRNILLDGAGNDVSEVIQSFGQFVVGGNYFVGFVVFAILVIINFIVITKGAGRVAEVGARFTLDAMPGKQMSIDAELNAGLIDKEEAKRRRAKIENEADFYGSMDGASKFVRGDAIAGIIITLVNVVVGLIIGVVQHDMSFTNAAQTFTLLTVGDGLVSQIPALIVSTAAGIVVTRASGSGGLSEDLNSQVIVHSKAFYISSGLCVAMALVGLPKVPFFLLAVLFFFLGRYADREAVRRVEAEQEKANEEVMRSERTGDSIEDLLHLDVLALEVGVDLVPMIDNKQDGEVLERIISARKQFAQDLGIIVPVVIIRDNIQLKSDEYQFLLKGNVIGSGRVHPRRFLAMDPGDVADPIDGIPTKEPAYGLDASWILPSQKEEASFRGYTVVNGSTVVVTHLTKLIQEYAHELIGRQEVHGLIESLREDHAKVIEEVLASDRLTLGDVVQILQNLLREGVSIRDLLTIFETLADHCKSIKNPDALTRHVRKALGRGIIKKYLTPDNQLVVTNLDRGVEDLLVAGIAHQEDGSTSLNIEPEVAQRLLNNVAESMQNFEASGTVPILMCGSRIRWDLRKLIARFIPGMVVMAFDEIPSEVQTQSLGTVSL